MARRAISTRERVRPDITNFSGRPAQASPGWVPMATRDDRCGNAVEEPRWPSLLCVPEDGSRDKPAPERHNLIERAPRGHAQHKGVYQMKSIKIMGLCLVAAFLVSAVAVATASASTPGFIFSGTARGFSSKSGAGKLVTKIGAEVKCTLDTDSGEINGASGTDKVKNVLVVFSGCTAVISGNTLKCNSEGQPAETIKTNQLEGQLGYINEAGKKVGLVLKAEAEKGLFATFTCGTGVLETKIKVRGAGETAGMIGEITPVNTPINPGGHFTLNYTQKAGELWRQVPNELKVLGTLITGLLLEAKIGGGGAWEFSGLETSDEVFPLITTTISA